MGKRSLRVFVVLMLVLGSLLAMGGIAVAQDSSASIYDNLVNAGNFTVLTSAIDEKGLTEIYAGDGNEYTLFAPTDAAFQALSVADRIKLYRNPETLVQTLQHMTVPGVVAADELTDGATLTTLDGGTLTVSRDGDTILVDGAEVSSPDLAASNGVIHVVDSVIPVGAAATTEAAAEATAEPEAEATAEAAEEATAEPEAEATAEPAEEATAAPAEEATAEPAEEATAEPAEEATAAPAEEATAAPAEEATAEPAEEATAAPAEEAAATPEPSEEAPEELPATGAEANSLALVAAAVLTLVLLGAVTFVGRRRA